MGSALLAAWLARGVAASIRVVDPNESPPPAGGRIKEGGASSTLTPTPTLPLQGGGGKIIRHMQVTAVPEAFIPDIVVFAVKPQTLDAVLPAYAKRFGALPLYVSIAAGKSLSYYAKHLRPDARIVRAMPNTPALVGQGITALVANAAARPQDRASAEALFAAAGSTVWLEDEQLMHAVTALSGSGPAYVFLFLESLMQAGMEAGLSPEVARRLAMETVAGSCALAAHENAGFKELREQVTSPGGTTEAGLKALTTAANLDFSQLIKKAIEQAIKRSLALAGQ